VDPAVAEFFPEAGIMDNSGSGTVARGESRHPILKVRVRILIWFERTEVLSFSMLWGLMEH
jgi:hypothetical protein